MVAIDSEESIWIKENGIYSDLKQRDIKTKIECLLQKGIFMYLWNKIRLMIRRVSFLVVLREEKNQKYARLAQVRLV